MDFSPDRIRLIASLAFNFVSKIPGIVAIFVILPLVSRGLGTSAYGELLSALALGSAFTLPFGGINAVGRRLLAGAVGAQDRTQQASVFVTTTFLMAAVAASAGVVMVSVTGHSWSTPVFILISLLPILANLCNVFDNMRASFNEHYVTALLQLLFQSSIYAAAYIMGLPKGNVVLAGLTLQSPFILASLATAVILLFQRPFLIAGRVTGLRAMLLPAVGVMLADGALGFSLNLSVYWLKFSGNTEMAAWVGTFARLFQSFMSPVLLIMFPITSYISMRWGSMPSARQAGLHKLFILIGLGYGCIVGAAMGFGGPLYIDHMFKLSVRGDSTDVWALSLFMGAVIAQKAYTMLLYAVSEARFISYGTAIVSVLGVASAAFASRWLPPARVIDVLFAFMGCTLPVLLLIGGYRYQRVSRAASVD